MKSGAKRIHAILLTGLILALTASIIVLIFGWSLAFKMSSNLSIAKTETSYLKKDAEALSNLGIIYRKNAQNKQIVLDSLPQSKDISSFLADVETLAGKNQLKVVETLVGDKNNKMKAGQDFSQTVNKGSYYELPVKITFEGSYNSFTKLAAQINSLRRIASISGVNVQKSLGNNAEKTDEVKAALSLSIFIKK